MSPLLRFLPFLFFLFLFVSSAALASDAPIANNNNKAKLLQLIKGNSNKIKTNANEDPATESTTTTTIAPTNPSTTAATTTTTAASTTMEQTTIPPSTTAPVIAYIRLVLTLKQKVAERLITPNAQGNTRKKLRTIIADAIGRPAEGLNITMTIDDVEGKNPNKKNPKVLLILLIALSSTDSAVKSIVDGANNSSSALSTQLMEETGADSISVQTTYGFPPSSNSDGLPFTSSDGSLFEAYKTLILAVSISVIGVVFLGAVILFLTKTKERRERLLELFRFGGRLRREQNHSSSTFDDKRNSGSKRVTKKSSTRHSGRTNSGRTTTSGRNSTINSTINSSVASVVKNQV